MDEQPEVTNKHTQSGRDEFVENWQQIFTPTKETQLIGKVNLFAKLVKSLAVKLRAAYPLDYFQYTAHQEIFDESLSELDTLQIEIETESESLLYATKLAFEAAKSHYEELKVPSAFFTALMTPQAFLLSANSDDPMAPREPDLQKINKLLAQERKRFAPAGEEDNARFTTVELIAAILRGEKTDAKHLLLFEQRLKDFFRIYGKETDKIVKKVLDNLIVQHCFILIKDSTDPLIELVGAYDNKLLIRLQGAFVENIIVSLRGKDYEKSRAIFKKLLLDLDESRQCKKTIITNQINSILLELFETIKELLEAVLLQEEASIEIVMLQVNFIEDIPSVYQQKSQLLELVCLEEFMQHAIRAIKKAAGNLDKNYKNALTFSLTKQQQKTLDDWNAKLSLTVKKLLTKAVKNRGQYLRVEVAEIPQQLLDMLMYAAIEANANSQIHQEMMQSHEKVSVPAKRMLLIGKVNLFVRLVENLARELRAAYPLDYSQYTMCQKSNRVLTKLAQLQSEIEAESEGLLSATKHTFEKARADYEKLKVPSDFFSALMTPGAFLLPVNSSDPTMPKVPNLGKIDRLLRKERIRFLSTSNKALSDTIELIVAILRGEKKDSESLNIIRQALKDFFDFHVKSGKTQLDKIMENLIVHHRAKALTWSDKCKQLMINLRNQNFTEAREEFMALLSAQRSNREAGNTLLTSQIEEAILEVFAEIKQLLKKLIRQTETPIAAIILKVNFINDIPDDYSQKRELLELVDLNSVMQSATSELKMRTKYLNDNYQEALTLQLSEEQQQTLTSWLSTLSPIAKELLHDSVKTWSKKLIHIEVERIPQQLLDILLYHAIEAGVHTASYSAAAVKAFTAEQSVFKEWEEKLKAQQKILVELSKSEPIDNEQKEAYLKQKGTAETDFFLKAADASRRRLQESIKAANELLAEAAQLLN